MSLLNNPDGYQLEYVMSADDYKYKIGFLVGYYEDTAEFKRYHLAFHHPAWQPYELKGDPEFELGYLDGQSQKFVPPFQEDDFFAFDIAGFPWGSMFEINLRPGFTYEKVEGMFYVTKKDAV
jgi:hypothetical protein